MTDQIFDVAVVGAGPAGATAAAFLAGRGRSVVLVGGESLSGRYPVIVWLSAQASPLLTELGVPSTKLLDQGFTDVSFFSADFSKQADPHFDQAPGYLVERAVLVSSLLDRARRASVEVRVPCDVTDLRLLESSVEVVLADGPPLSAKTLVMATGSCPVLLDRLGISRRASGSGFWSLHVDATIPPKDRAKQPGVRVVLGLDRKNSFAMFCVRANYLSAALFWYGEPDEARSTFARICQQAYVHGGVPIDLSTEAIKQSLETQFGAAALDIESHVGKHTLVVGDAGGFMSAVSNEGLYPAMWSAQIAAEVLDEALTSECSQDVLMTYDSRWRLSMADYLRSPNTDTQFLLPLVFSNQKMANRMGGAFFSGENI